MVQKVETRPRAEAESAVPAFAAFTEPLVMPVFRSFVSLVVEHQIIIIGDALVTSDCFLKK